LTAVPSATPAPTATLIPTEAPMPTALPEEFSRLRDAVVRIETTTGFGSGTIIDTEGHILTNYHVVSGFSLVVVRVADEFTVPATVVGFDEVRDIGIIKVDPGTLELAALPLSNRRPEVGDEIITIGYPLGLEGQSTLTGGQVSAIRNETGQTFIQTDTAIDPGSSGGAAIDLEGNFIGVPTATKFEADNIGFLVPGFEIFDQIQRMKDGFQFVVLPTPTPVVIVTPTPAPTPIPDDDYGNDKDSASSTDLTLINSPLLIRGELESPNDTDTFKIQGVSGDIYIFASTFIPSSPLIIGVGRPKLVLYTSSNSSPLETVDNDGFMECRPTSDAAMYLDVSNHNDEFTGPYQVVVDRVK